MPYADRTAFQTVALAVVTALLALGPGLVQARRARDARCRARRLRSEGSRDTFPYWNIVP